MRKTSPLNYAFAVGKVRALEKFLIKQEVFEEAIESSLNETLRLFAESDLYSDELLYVKDSRQLEEVLNKELLNLKKLIKPLVLDKEVLSLLESDDINHLKGIIRKNHSEFLNNYLSHLIDMHNIKTFLRLYVLKEPQDKLQAYLTEGGFISKKIFFELYTQDLSVFGHRLEYVHKGYRIVNYTSYLGEGIQRLEKENSFVALEKAINDFLIDILRPAKYLSFGPEPILAYYFAKLNEINLIRMIILAKLNDVSDIIVKERLNSVYA